jgi:hypothetical protein
MIMGEEEGGRQFSLGYDYVGEGRRRHAFFPGIDDAARGRRQAIFSRTELWGQRKEAGIFPQEWMMRPEEGGRHFSLG